jgi:hypothetical protein
MKNTILLSLTALFIFGTVSCRKKGELPKEVVLDSEVLKDTTTVTYVDSSVFHFDTLMQGDKAEHTFRIINTGEHNLVIARAFGSCGCTVPEYPKEPVKPGDTASIHVTFSSAGKEGEQNKNVTLVCNTATRSEMIYMKGFVKTEEKK